MRSRPATADEVRAGDLVTELWTPDGPFYRVLSAAAGWVTVDSADPGEPPRPVTLRYGARDWLRIADRTGLRGSPVQGVKTAP